MTGKQVFLTALFAAAFAALAFSTPAAAASQLIGGTLTVGGLKYSPYPAEPGKYIDFFLGLNNGAYPINDVECKLDSLFPFSVDDSSQATQKISFLPIGQGTVLKYKIRVADNAVTGYNDLQVSCRSRGTDWVTIKMQVYVQVQESVVSVKSVSFTPSEVKPGENVKVTIVLENAGNSPIKDVSLKLAFTDDQPFTTTGSSNAKRIALMEPKSEAQASFDVLAYASAAIKTYRIPLELTYYSANGSKLTRTDYAGVVVESKPELSVALESSTIRSTNTTGSIFLSVVNKGVADAKFLEVEVAPTNGLTILSGAKTYVGALDSDDYQTVEIKAYAETGASELRLPVALRFKDANNRAYEQQSAVVVPLYSQAELEKYGYATPQSLLVTVAAIIVILLAAWWAYKKFFKNNAKRT